MTVTGNEEPLAAERQGGRDGSGPDACLVSRTRPTGSTRPQVSTAALPRSRTHSLREHDQPTAPAATKGDEFQHPGILQNDDYDLDSDSQQKGENWAEQGSSGDRQYAPCWESDQVATMRRH